MEKDAGVNDVMQQLVPEVSIYSEVAGTSRNYEDSSLVPLPSQESYQDDQEAYFHDVEDREFGDSNINPANKDSGMTTLVHDTSMICTS